MERPARILISEDTDTWQGIFKRLLSDENYDVRSAMSLEETKWQLERCYFEIVLVDICLDEKNESNTDGIETMRFISSLSEGTQVIILTGHGTVPLAVSAFKEYGAFHFLQKEKLNPSAFLDIVGQAITKAKNSLIKSELQRDHLSYFQTIDLDHASSTLGMKPDRLEFFLRHLVNKTAPIPSPKNRAHLVGTGRDSTIVFDYWSKAFACGAHLTVGAKRIVATTKQINALVSLEEDELVGIVEAVNTGRFEDYVETSSL